MGIIFMKDLLVIVCCSVTGLVLYCHDCTVPLWRASKLSTANSKIRKVFLGKPQNGCFRHGSGLYSMVIMNTKLLHGLKSHKHEHLHLQYTLNFFSSIDFLSLR